MNSFYKTPFTEQQIEFVRGLWSDPSYDFKHRRVAKEVAKSFDDLSDMKNDTLRYRVRSLVGQFEKNTQGNEYRPSKVYEKQEGESNESLRQRIADDQGCNVSEVNVAWIKTNDGEGNGSSIQIKFGAGSGIDYTKSFQSILEEYENKLIAAKRVVSGNDMLVVCLSDIHIGLDPNGIYSYEYNGKVFLDMLNNVLGEIKGYVDKNGAYDKMLILDLGDGLDGWDGYTTRGGHSLKQNMNNDQQFEAYTSGKIRLNEAILSNGYCKELLIRNVGNCNHSGSFGRIANKAIEMVCTRVYDNISFETYENFRGHISYGKHMLCICHGKDEHDMKRGLPVTLTDKAVNYINGHIRRLGDMKGKLVTVIKGDLHQYKFESCSTFGYLNLASFAPPSTYCQGNFEQSGAGFSILEVLPDRIKPDFIPLNYKMKEIEIEEIL